MSENRKLKVFLCHSKDDKLKVRELYRRLVTDGYDAWLDEEKLMPGQDWDLEIRKAVRESDVVVVCLSRGSISKAGYVQKELRFALDVADEQPEDAIFIIPARLDDCQVPSRLLKWQWVNLFETNGVEKLKLSLILRANSLGASIPAFVEPQIVCIPAGRFIMGSTMEQAYQVIKEGGEHWAKRVVWEQPQHTVELSEYFIGQYPVTNHEYQAFIREAKHTPPPGWDGDQFPVEKGNHPVVHVSWEDAATYCKWLSEKSGKYYRLPTEAEWEKAARGEDGRIFPWGNDFDVAKANTNGDKKAIQDTSAVGHFSPAGDSIYGCADMSGNVWEWCNDWFGENEYGAGKRLDVINPRGPQGGSVRVLRGGSFGNDIWNARCTYRYRYDPANSSYNRGFRVVFSPVGKSEL